MTRRAMITLGVLAVLLAAVVVVRLAVGDRTVHLPESGLIWQLRWHRVVAGVAVGVMLGVSGVVLQSLLRNPLASPDLVGASSGAALGVVVSAWLGVLAGSGGAMVLGQAVPAGIGALGALAVVSMLSRRGGMIEPITMILVGVIVSIIASSMSVVVMQLMLDRGFGIWRWFFGSLSDDLPAAGLWGGAVLAVVGMGVGVWLGPAMDAAALGDDEAHSVGVDLARLRLVQFVTGGLLAGGAVVLAGPIGFVGLVCPHVVRLAAGPGHRVLVVGAGLAGAVLIVGADAAVMAIRLESGRLPIGVLTAMIGGPVFLVLLRSELRAPGRV